jgi:hypothetical protein
MSEDDPVVSSWEQWPEQMAQEARSVVEYVHTGAPVEAMAGLDKMIVELNARRATVAELANALD